jgi:putative transposase
VTQRGNRRQDIFFNDQDRRVYLQTLARFCGQHDVALEAYCLMTNHVHLIAVPHRNDSLAKALGQAHRNFARWHNVTHGHSGHLWQNRFYSCPLENQHWCEALLYVELNPVRAGVVSLARDWPWSSARAHLAGEDSTGMLELTAWRKQFTPDIWSEALKSGLASAELAARIREATRTGRPVGSPEYVSRLERAVGYSLRPMKRGRKPKTMAAAAGHANLEIEKESPITDCQHWRNLRLLRRLSGSADVLLRIPSERDHTL